LWARPVATCSISSQDCDPLREKCPRLGLFPERMGE
jgi:hypothetical protein